MTVVATRTKTRAAIALGLLTLSALAALPLQAADRSALWNIVNGKCVPDWQSTSNPEPCVSVDIKDGPEHGVAILKDIVGIAQHLAIPTQRISGVEDAQLLAPGAPNLFAAAWGARPFVYEKLGKWPPRDTLGMAINSSNARSQDQAHVHLDCLREDVRTEIAKRLTGLTTTWAAEPLLVDGKPYKIARIDSVNLAGVSPFQLVAKGLPEAKDGLAKATIVVTGATFEDGHDGFVVLASFADAAIGNAAHGEDLLDHSCAIAKAG